MAAAGAGREPRGMSRSGTASNARPRDAYRETSRDSASQTRYRRRTAIRYAARLAIPRAIPHPGSEPPPMSDALILDRVTKRFGEKVAVDAISMRIPSGTIYGFLGKNGAGKTTTIRMIM